MQLRKRASIVPDLTNSMGLAQYHSAFYGSLDVLSVKYLPKEQNDTPSLEIKN